MHQIAIIIYLRGLINTLTGKMDIEENRLTFPYLFGETLRKYGSRSSFAFVGETPDTYDSTYRKIRSLMAFLEKNGIEKGDKVAILSNNSPNWVVSYFAVTFMGAVIVPVLPDFSPTEVANVLEHSGSKVVFISSNLLPRIAGFESESLVMTVLVDDFSVIASKHDAAGYIEGQVPSREYKVEEEDLASIIYTSGTTGRSKGVMLTHKNISFNALKGFAIQPIDENDRFLSVLPLSHTYENTLGLILPMLAGSSVYYLRKPPTPSVLLPALEEVRPSMMLTVPLIMEKIYFNKILPSFRDSFIFSLLYGIPALRKMLNAAAGKKLKKTFGGNLKFFGIGGAKLNKTVEKFLMEAKFPYAIGYGLTETAPLLAGANPSKSVLESTGPAIEDIELKINKPDSKTGQGEIWARGPNVMKGYYKESEMTQEVLTPDGWFKTGDLGAFDRNNNLYIKGRLKNMIVGASGENIYPEEIESIINNFRYVVESLVVEKKGKLVALVHINREELEEKFRSLKHDVSRQFDDFIEEVLKELHAYVNSQVNKFSQIHRVVLQPDPFQKTATLKIKRFLYT